jgi:class 3 adenylate cyclase
VPHCTSCGRESADDFAFCPHCGASFVEVAPEREQRKTVTVLFCDVTGSTELGEKLDPETLRTLLARYFERMSAIVERHGGTVEKFIGDAVMAVFGVPVVHEDDALRAVRAAVEMREAFAELGVKGRIGVTTGEVVSGTEERLATGDAVNVAARLEQAAQPGEILIGEETLHLVRAAVEAQPLELLELKGKAESVAAYRLLSLAGEMARRHEAPMVGREREQRLLADAWERVASERACHLFTILGPAGVGKSRLAAEFLASLEDALMVRGRCLPYGEGITYWPVVEVVKQLPKVETDPVAAETMLGLVSDQQLVSSSEEIAWAFRKQLEAVAAEQPLICVLDDVHWGEETFLDLVEHVADLSRDAPILVLCMARPDLLDRRSGWGGGKVNATTVLLEPLAREETELLIASLAHLDEGLRERILEAAEGNPLFVEEMVALVQESGDSDGEITVPPTIQALLAARLDQLDASERDVLQRGSVEGRLFHRGAVQALAPEEQQVMVRLTSLIRKELVRPDKAQLPGEDAFRFRHLLIRDAAYDALPKAARAELHQRFADWLEQHGAELVELDEILGYHLEQAYRYQRELGLPDESALGAKAGEHLAVAGRRAGARGDVGGEVNLLGRALDLLPGHSLELELELAGALFNAGRPADGEELLAGAAAHASARGERAAELCARLARTRIASHTDPEGKMAELLALAEEAIPVFEAAGDERGQMSAWEAIGEVEHYRCHWEARNKAFERAADHASRADEERMTQELTARLAAGYHFGPAPVEEVLRWHETQRGLERKFTDLMAYRGGSEALEGRFEEARTLLAQARARADELGAQTLSVIQSELRWQVEMLAEDFTAAERESRWGCEMLEQMGERAWLSTEAGELAQALYALGRYDEAEEWARKSKEAGASDDIITQMVWRQVLAKVQAHRGELADAERLSREAVEYGEDTDMLVARGLARLDLAEVLEVADRREEAAGEVEKALELFERKGALPMVGQAQARLAALL